MQVAVPLVAVLLLLSSCTQQLNKPESTGSSGTFTPVEVKYASHFQVEYSNSGCTVRVFEPYEGSSDTLVYRLQHVADGSDAIMVPVSSMVLLSTTHVALATALSLHDQVVGISGVRFVYDQEMRARIEAGRISEVGSDAMLQPESIIALQPDLVMSYSMGASSNAPLERLTDVGIPIVINADYMETHPLGLCEWLKFMAVFTGREMIANQLFESIDGGYHAITEKVVDHLEAGQAKPTVFTGDNWSGTWSVPAGNSFSAIYLRDAGAEYLWSHTAGTGKLLLDFETVFAQAAEADVWLNPGSFGSLDEIASADSRYKLFKAWKTGMVFSNNARVNESGGYDYFESGVVNPHVVLMDLVEIFHPDILNHDLVYYRQLQ
jgi:iron complex transport system substrate-binding protein